MAIGDGLREFLRGRKLDTDFYKNRHGKYSFAGPLFDRFILRQMARNDPARLS